MIAYKILYLTIYFVFKRNNSIFVIIEGHLGAHRFGVSFPKLYKHSLKYFELYLLTIVYEKNDIRKFCLFVYLGSYNDKSKFSFLQTVHQAAARLICDRAIFTQTASIVS